MKIKSLVLILLLIPFSAGAEGLSAWEKLGAGTLADTDMIPITDVSDTTQSADGSSKTLTATQLKTYVLSDAVNIVVDGTTIDETEAPAGTFTLGVPTGGIGATQIASTAVTPGSYTNTNLTVDADGRITAAANGSGGSFAFDTFPTYEDSAHSSNLAINATTLAVYSTAAGKWMTASLTDSLDPTPAPTLSSRTIGTNGTTLTLAGSESLSVGSGGDGGFDVDCATAGAGITATYASGAPGSSLVYTLGTTVNSGDTCDLDYTQPGNGIEATTGGIDLASITSGAITNNSSQSSEAAPSVYWKLEDNAATGTVVEEIGTYSATASGATSGFASTGTGCWDGGCFKLPATSSRVYSTNSTVLGYLTDDVFTIELTFYGDGSSSMTTNYARLVDAAGATFRILRNNSDTSLRVVTGASTADFTVADLDDGNVQKIRVIFNTNEASEKVKVYQKVGTGGTWTSRGTSANFSSLAALTTLSMYGDSSSGWHSSTGTYKVDEVKIWNAAVTP